MLPSTVFDWTKIEPKPTKTGETRPFFKSETATLDEMSCHVTTLNPGEAAHAPHQHPEEEMIIVKEGTLDALVNTNTTRMGPGSVFFIAPNDLHGVRNAGNTRATYYVLKWFPAGLKQT
jgi:XRE family transcriptional regulator, regulator of sulfur utilization